MAKPTPAEKRARLREAAASRIARHGLAGFNLHAFAPLAGIKFDLARHYYRTNEALIADIVHTHHATLGELMADAVLAARPLAGPARVEALAAALLAALAAEHDVHRATIAATAALPEVAHAARHADRWLLDEFAAALGREGPDGEILARSLMVLAGHWAARLAPDDAAGRAVCARLLAEISAPSPHAGARAG